MTRTFLCFSLLRWSALRELAAWQRKFKVLEYRHVTRTNSCSISYKFLQYLFDPWPDFPFSTPSLYEAALFQRHYQPPTFVVFKSSFRLLLIGLVLSLFIIFLFYSNIFVASETLKSIPQCWAHSAFFDEALVAFFNILRQRLVGPQFIAATPFRQPLLVFYICLTHLKPFSRQQELCLFSPQLAMDAFCIERRDRAFKMSHASINV